MSGGRRGDGAGRRPMKVCHVMHTMGVGGAEVLISNMIRRGSPEVEFCVVLLDEMGPLGDQLAGEGIEVRCVGRRPGVDWRLLGDLKKTFIELAPDLVHCHQYTPWFYGGWAAARSKLPVVFTEHGRHQPDRPRVRRILFNRYLLRRTGAITAVSGSIKRALVENEKLPADRIRVLYNGIDHHRFFADEAGRRRMRDELHLAPDELAIGHAGRLMSVKNQAMLLRALARLRDLRPDLEWKALLAGKGPLEEELRRLHAELELGERVVFLGQRRDVPELLRAFDVFALSSFSEGTSVTLLEAMATELPVVATRVGGNPELIEEGVNGYLTPNDDAEAFAQALARMDDPALRRRMGQAARSKVLERFTEEGMVEGFLSIYRDLLSRDGRARGRGEERS